MVRRYLGHRAAIALGADLAGIVAYDQRLLKAARTAGITTAAPA